MALTRARVIWASDEDFADVARAAIETELRRPRDRGQTAEDVLAMRRLLERERPPVGFWDMKRPPGGLIDIEFAVQFLQLVHAAEGGPLKANTAAALVALRDAGLAPGRAAQSLLGAWTLQQDVDQLLKIALPPNADPAAEPQRLRALLAKAGGARDFKALKMSVVHARASARSAFESLLGAV